MEPTSISLTATTSIAPMSIANDIKVSMIEIVPQGIKQEKMEECVDSGLNQDDLAIIDTALNLDPSLSELNVQVCMQIRFKLIPTIYTFKQNHLWDDFEDPTSAFATCK